MSLAPCRVCGDQVATEAITCPHCGAPLPAHESRAWLVGPGSLELKVGWAFLLIGSFLWLASPVVGLGFLLAAFVLSIIAVTRGLSSAGLTLMLASMLVWAFLLYWFGMRA